MMGYKGGQVNAQTTDQTKQIQATMDVYNHPRLGLNYHTLMKVVTSQIALFYSCQERF